MIFLRILSCDLTRREQQQLGSDSWGEQLRRGIEAVHAESSGFGENIFLGRIRVSADKDAKSLILDPIAARLGVGDALFLLIANRDSAEESRTAGFAGKQVALTVHQNSSLGCASGHGQSEAKDKYCSHKLNLYVSVSRVR